MLLKPFDFFISYDWVLTFPEISKPANRLNFKIECCHLMLFCILAACYAEPQIIFWWKRYWYNFLNGGDTILYCFVRIISI